MANKWTGDELAFLRDNPEMLLKDIALKLGRSINAVRGKRSELGVQRTLPQVGSKFGYLTILNYYYKTCSKQKHLWVHCLCDCGKEHDGVFYDIKRGQNISCGCRCKSSDRFNLGINIGDRINRLLVLDIYKKNKKSYAKCQCDCGNIIYVRLTVLKQQKTKSCGCLKSEIISTLQSEKNNNQYKHGLTHHRLYKIWYGMKNRCYNIKQYSYKDYGGRGVQICKEWFDNFLIFYDWAMKNGYKDFLQIDRIDVNQNYCPQNCRWTTKTEQSRNKRNSNSLKITAFGETKSVYEWLDDTRCTLTSVSALGYRICAGWTPERAITQLSERCKN